MQPRLQRNQAFSVAGVTVRTSNSAQDGSVATSIGALWTRFFDERVYQTTPHRSNDLRLYGVYSAYESDASGPFDLTAGIAVAEGASVVRIEAGDYLVFAGQGEMPQMLVALWQTIRQYFEQHPEIRRSYRSDFEAYSGPDAVAIHIGVRLE